MAEQPTYTLVLVDAPPERAEEGNFAFVRGVTRDDLMSGVHPMTNRVLREVTETYDALAERDAKPTLPPEARELLQATAALVGSGSIVAAIQRAIDHARDVRPVFGGDSRNAGYLDGMEHAADIAQTIARGGTPAL